MDIKMGKVLIGFAVLPLIVLLTGVFSIEYTGVDFGSRKLDENAFQI
jgi:hypothetical protein